MGDTKVRSWATDVDEKTAAQVANTAAMPFVKGVRLMPDAHLGLGSTVGSVIATEGAIMPAAVGVDIGCFRGDTRVPLLNGTQMSLAAMAECSESFWVYSLNDHGDVVPGMAVALKTRTNAELLKVTVSGGDEIVCTPDHPFMLRDGTYRQAAQLRFNESLMPLYRRWQTRDGYESVSTGQGHSHLTHLAVYVAINGLVPDGMVVHHKNHIHFDNDPGNLEAVEQGEHSRHHRETGHSFDNKSAAFQLRRRAGIRAANARPARQTQMVATGIENITKYMQTRPEHFKEAVAGNGRRGAPFLTKFNISPRPCGDCDYEARNPADLRWHKDREHGYNHKVISVESLAERADVYCLQVEEHHNFALAAGVFVHNCGMVASQLHLTASDLPENLDRLLARIEAAIPAGLGKQFDCVNPDFFPMFNPGKPSSWPHAELNPKQVATAIQQFGTLGSGNHFVEVCLDAQDGVWVVLHSGSRGIGNQLAKIHIEGAKKLMKRYFIDLPDPDLAYFVQDTPEFKHYIADMLWAQAYALASRERMMNAALNALIDVAPFDGTFTEAQRINTHHNFTAMEEVYPGRNLWVTRKGAVRAREGDWCVIPGSMATGTYIGRGLGNKASYQSCSHGAGRKMSRTQARKTLTVDSLVERMGTRAWNDDSAEALLDEHPDSYKRIEDVMAAQADLVEPVYRLRSVLNYKGTDSGRRR